MQLDDVRGRPGRALRAVEKAHPVIRARVGGIALWNRGCVRPDPAGGVTKDMPGGAVASGGEVVAPCGMNRP